MANVEMKYGSQLAVPHVLAADAKNGDVLAMGAGQTAVVVLRDGLAGETVSVDAGVDSVWLCEVDAAYAAGAWLYHDGVAANPLTSSGNLFGTALQASSAPGDKILVALHGRAYDPGP